MGRLARSITQGRGLRALGAVAIKKGKLVFAAKKNKVCFANGARPSVAKGCDPTRSEGEDPSTPCGEFLFLARRVGVSTRPAFVKAARIVDSGPDGRTRGPHLATREGRVVWALWGRENVDVQKKNRADTNPGVPTTTRPGRSLMKLGKC